jgi:hypothetical protein
MKTKISYSDQICIKEVLTALYTIKWLLPASIIYSKFKNTEIVEDLEDTPYIYAVLQLDTLSPVTNFIEYYSYGSYCLSEEGKRFINAVKARKQTRYLLKKGCDLFPETANLILTK